MQLYFYRVKRRLTSPDGWEPHLVRIDLPAYLQHDFIIYVSDVLGIRKKFATS